MKQKEKQVPPIESHSKCFVATPIHPHLLLTPLHDTPHVIRLLFLLLLLQLEVADIFQGRFNGAHLLPCWRLILTRSTDNIH